jgi:hypothetical protein
VIVFEYKRFQSPYYWIGFRHVGFRCSKYVNNLPARRILQDFRRVLLMYFPENYILIYYTDKRLVEAKSDARHEFTSLVSNTRTWRVAMPGERNCKEHRG